MIGDGQDATPMRITLCGGRRVGDQHPASTMPTPMVVAMRDLHEKHGYTEREVARHFGKSFWTVRRVLRYQTRASVAERTVDLEAIKARYSAGNVTQRQLAEECGVSVVTMQRWLSK